MPMSFRPFLAATLLASAGMPALHAADPPAAIAAEVIAKNAQALVEIQATLSIKPEFIEGPPGIAEMIDQQPAEEQPAESKGIVIHSTGLIVAPLATLDPGAMLGGGMELDTPMGKLKLKIKTTVSTLKIVTADGHEYPAEVILREPAAGFALIKLTSPPEGGLTAVTLTRDLPAPLPFSQIFDLVRLEADFGRAPAVRLIRVVQTTPPPVPLYDVTGPLQTPGSAAFDMSGRFLGISVIPLRGEGGGAAIAEIAQTGPSILPTAEILRLSAKALP
jgi:hypothetical protein